MPSGWVRARDGRGGAKRLCVPMAEPATARADSYWAANLDGTLKIVTTEGTHTWAVKARRSKTLRVNLKKGPFTMKSKADSCPSDLRHRSTLCG